MRAQFKTTVTELAGQDERVIVVLGDVSVYMFKDFWDCIPSGSTTWASARIR